MKILKWLKKLFTGQLAIVDRNELFFLRELENDNKFLHRDIHNLVCKPNEPDGISTRMRYEMNYQLGQTMLNATRQGAEFFKGFCENFNINSPNKTDSALLSECKICGFIKISGKCKNHDCVESRMFTKKRDSASSAE